MFTVINTSVQKVFINVNRTSRKNAMESLFKRHDAYVAADDIESAYMKKIPLWALGFLY